MNMSSRKRTGSGTCWLLSVRGSALAKGVSARFFRMENEYLFIGEHKYWLMTGYMDIDPYNDEGDYVLNRARLYRDRRDFVVQPGDSGMPEDYPTTPARQ